MAGPTQMECSRTVALSAQAAFDGLLPIPLEHLFNRRYGPIPAIRSVDGPAEPWGRVGQSRVVHLADGGSMREELTIVDRPSRFGYILSDIRGPMRPLVAHVEGTWTFEPSGSGAVITWSWVVHPRSALSRPLLPVFARIWRGYARRALNRIDELLSVDA